ncbi:MAG TPA: glycosyltransferase, partial [Thermomicrobiaceae bacterium]|nr:glycosyltransferase [Thermomicrobiaceae bacterium]
MPTVLMLVENRSATSDVRVWPEALALRAAGFEVCAISPMGRSADTQTPHARVDGIDVYRYPLVTGDGALAFTREYAAALLASARLSWTVWRRHRFDVLHVANPPDIFFPLAWFY